MLGFQVPKLMSEVVPAARIILILRHPVERFYSEFVQASLAFALASFLHMLYCHRYHMKLRRVQRQMDVQKDEPMFRALYDDCASTHVNYTAWQRCFLESLRTVDAFRIQVMSRPSRSTKFELCLQRTRAGAGRALPTFEDVYSCFKPPFVTYAAPRFKTALHDIALMYCGLLQI